MRSVFFAASILALSLAVSGCVETVSGSSGPYISTGYISSGVSPGYTGARLIRRGDNMYFNGHRGYRNPRAGYRSHQGYWFPGAAFAGIVTINGGYQQDRPRYGGNTHVSWCSGQYRSYRVTDNSFNTGSGRRFCNSPYN